MEPEQQVTILETSKKLKKLGVKQESLFYWVSYPKSLSRLDDTHLLYRSEKNDKLKNKDGNEWISAFTVAELVELLPDHIDVNKVCYHIKFDKQDRAKGLEKEISWKHKYWLQYWDMDDEDADDLVMIETTESLAETCGKMLIYLLENKLIEL